MNKPFKTPSGGAIPFDFSPHGAPRQEPRRDFEEGLQAAIARPKAVQSKFYRQRKRTKADDDFERRKFPGVFD